MARTRRTDGIPRPSTPTPEEGVLSPSWEEEASCVCVGTSCSWSGTPSETRQSARECVTHTYATGNPLSPQPRDCHVLLRNTQTRRAARKFKFHGEGVLARGRRAEKPPFARVLPRPTHQTSRCGAGVNHYERQMIDSTLPRGVTAVVLHGARRGVVAMANRRTPKIPQMHAFHVTQPHVRTMPSNVRRRGHGVRRRRSAVRHRDGAASHDVHDDAEDHNGRDHGCFHGHGHGRDIVRVVRARVI